jgi:hypothetical protein
MRPSEFPSPAPWGWEKVANSSPEDSRAAVGQLGTNPEGQDLASTRQDEHDPAWSRLTVVFGSVPSRTRTDEEENVR